MSRGLRVKNSPVMGCEDRRLRSHSRPTVFLGPGTRSPASALRGLKKKCTSGTPPLSLFLLYTPFVSLSRPFPLTNLSAESEPFFRFHQTPGYIGLEMTPGKYRDLGEPSQIGSTQGGCPLVFGRSDGVGVPIFVGAFAPPPPTATQGQREGGGQRRRKYQSLAPPHLIRGYYWGRPRGPELLRLTGNKSFSGRLG